MAALDPKDPPNENRTVTIGYLNELYAKADKLQRLERAVRELLIVTDSDIDAACDEILTILEET